MVQQTVAIETGSKLLIFEKHLKSPNQTKKRVNLRANTKCLRVSSIFVQLPIERVHFPL